MVFHTILDGRKSFFPQTLEPSGSKQTKLKMGVHEVYEVFT